VNQQMLVLPAILGQDRILDFAGGEVMVVSAMDIIPIWPTIVPKKCSLWFKKIFHIAIKQYQHLQENSEMCEES